MMQKKKKSSYIYLAVATQSMTDSTTVKVFFFKGIVVRHFFLDFTTVKVFL